MTLDDVDAFARSLANVEVGARYGNRTWLIGKKGIAWARPFSKADLKRFGDAPIPQGEILAIATENLDAKEALLGLPGFFTIEHFNGYAAVLVELRKARVRDVKAAIKSAHRHFS